MVKLQPPPHLTPIFKKGQKSELRKNNKRPSYKPRFVVASQDLIKPSHTRKDIQNLYSDKTSEV